LKVCAVRPYSCSHYKPLTGYSTGQNTFFFAKHPIKWVRVAGVVVAIDEYARRRIYTIDDSSGATIECVVTLLAPHAKAIADKDGATAKSAATIERDARNDNSKPAKDPEPVMPITKRLVLPDNVCDADVGYVLDVKGGISVFRDQMQITIEKAIRLRTTEEEVRFWEKVRDFRRSVLAVPWSLSEKEVRRCRRQAEGRETKDLARRKRVKLHDGADQRHSPEPKNDKVSKIQSRTRPAKQTGLERRVRARHGSSAKLD
jgi:hypothetical protein